MRKMSGKSKMASSAKSEKMSMGSCDCNHPGCCCQPYPYMEWMPAGLFIAGIVVAAWGLSYIDTKTAGLLLAAGLIIKAVILFMKRSM